MKPRPFSKQNHVGDYAPQIRSLDASTRLSLLDVMAESQMSSILGSRHDPRHSLACPVYYEFLGNSPNDVYDPIQYPVAHLVGSFVRDAAWYEVLDLLQFLLDALKHPHVGGLSDNPKFFTDKVNAVFERHHARFVIADGKIVEVDESSTEG